jgi:hypothetical protein
MMNNRKNDVKNIEQRLYRFFQKQAKSLKASEDLWPKLESRLGEKLKDTRANNTKGGFSWWLSGPRLVAMSASLSLVLILVVVGSLWLTANHTANNMPSMSGGSVADAGSHGSIVLGPSSGPTGAGVTLGAPGATGPAGPVGTNVNISAGGFSSNSAVSSYGVLDTAQRQVIYQATVSLEVNTVPSALTQVQTLAKSLGGWVDNISSYGGQTQTQATITIRVPQDQFFTALDNLQNLGTVQSQNVSSQDVTEQYIDLEARLKSSQLEKQSLQALLDKVATVNDEILIQGQLTQVESQIESLQGQINYIQNRVDMASITVTLNTPPQNVGQPPSADLTVAVSNVKGSLASVKQLISAARGIVDMNTISFSNGKESAALSLRVYRSDFEHILASIESEGQTRQKTVQEPANPQQEQIQTGSALPPPDATISLSLIEASGFWTTTNIRVVAIAGGVIILTLLVFLGLARRAGLLSRKIS